MVRVNFEFGVLIKKAALIEKGIDKSAVFKAMNCEKAYSECESLLSFGPHFGSEAVDVFSKRLITLGLEYWDDFFETYVDHPTWCQFEARLT